ncbi:hypothetical protein [Sporosarcina sp. JAI121]|uniref:hypothetical protein n=1 Tax=Sporosarcina sp. JAI121 TaxID=2723064 RepID=UPI0015C857AD|nr:hypothetical protein [Sporosarcina sp. JAI121]NYF23572.1 hypothetical protein [Sporosarcina sp. JAI121]
MNEKAIGSFEGVSAVIPTKITMNTTSVQSKVGNQVILSAYVGAKEAGVPVTFNVDATGTLNKDQIFEVVTNAEGIATFSYTQYSADVDRVAVYPTGAATVRDFATVYWGVDNILTVTPADDKKTNTLNNGEAKIYNVTYKDQYTGKPVADQVLHVTLAENVDVSIDKITKATVNGVTPYQLTSGLDKSVTIKTNSKGEATFTVTGSNTKATPVVFKDEYVTNQTLGNNTLQPTELRATAETLTFTAIQSTYNIEVTRDGEEEAAIGLDNGRKYNVVVKDKDGKVAAGETVNVALTENLSKIIGTSSNAYFVKDKATAGKQITVKLDKDGKGSFVIASSDTTQTDYATPVVWIDINSSSSSLNGKLEEGEPTKVADRTYFVAPKLVGATLKSYLGTTEKDSFTGIEPATFKYNAVNQSGKAYNPGNVIIDAEFQVLNTGTEDVQVGDTVISPSRYATIKASGLEPSIQVTSVGNKTTSVVVTAYGITRDTKVNLGHKEAKASFTSTSAVGTIHTGVVKAIDTVDEEITFDGKDAISYADANYTNVNKVTLNKADFEKLVSDNLGTIRVTVTKDANGKYTFEIVSLDAKIAATVEAVNASTAAAQVVTALEASGFVPAFSALKSTAQKDAVGARVFADRNASGGGMFTEAGLKASYTAQYDAEVKTAVTAVQTAANANDAKTAIANVPGVDISGITALAAGLQTDVYTDLAASFTVVSADNGAKQLVALQTAITNAITKANVNAGKAGVQAAVDAINLSLKSAAAAPAVGEIATAKTTLIDKAATAGINLSTFTAATAAQQDVALTSIMNTTLPTYTAAALQTALNNAVAVATDVVAPTVSKAEFDASTGKLSITFSENVVLSATDTGSIDFELVEGGATGAVAFTAIAAGTNAKELVFTLTNPAAEGFAVDSVVSDITITTATIKDLAKPTAHSAVLTGLDIKVVAKSN